MKESFEIKARQAKSLRLYIAEFDTLVSSWYTDNI